jgi:hypothetical protein
MTANTSMRAKRSASWPRHTKEAGSVAIRHWPAVCGRVFAITWLSVAASACGGGRTLAEIKAMPESKLLYPGSTVMDTTGGDESCGIDTGCTSAYLDVVAKVDATSADIVAWYQRKLGDGGWAQIATPNPNDLVFTRGNYFLYRVFAGPAYDNRSYSIEFHICRMVLPADPVSIRSDC